MTRLRRVTAFALSGVLAIVQLLVIIPTASAVGSFNGSLNPIISGLWNGADFNLSSLNSTTTSSPAQPTQPSAPQQPTTPKPAPPSGRYAALGDSVAAGAGLPATPNDDARCGRSTQAYAYTVAQSLKLPLAHIACSGATAGDLVTKQRVGGPNIPAQLDAAYANGKPTVISITAGANDTHWDGFLRKCYSYKCGTFTDRTLFDAAVAVLSAKYYYALSDIQARSGSTPPRVVLTGYYNPLSSACATTYPQFTSSELAWINSAVTELNSTIQETASHFPFAAYAPVNFTGHDICSGNSWVQGASDSAPFHPNASGQQAIARAVLGKLQ